MKTYQFLWRMIRYRPWLYLADCLLWTLIHISPLVPGLIAQAFFDTISKNSHLGFGLWSLIVLLIVTALARAVLLLGGALTDIPHRFIMSALLRRNLLVFGLGGIAVPFIAIKAIDLLINALGMA